MIFNSYCWLVVGVWISLLPVSGLPLSDLLLPVSRAQVTTAITPDGSLGTTVKQSGTVYNIDDGTIIGKNQFHSLNRFTVGMNDTASFNGPNGITNIVSRVTGGNQSYIDGELRSTIPDANLYLLNPSGVIFGEHASLDVTGSFHVSTADYLKLADGERFYADLRQGSVLSAAPPEAFGFLNENPAGIRIEGSFLSIPDSETLSIVAGDIGLSGRGRPTFDDQGNAVPSLGAPGGRINFASVASAGEVNFKPSDQTQALNPALNVDTFARLGKIDISQGALIEVSGERGGTVNIRGGTLVVDNAEIFAHTTGNVNGAATGIDVAVTDKVAVQHNAVMGVDTREGTGAGGDVEIQAGRLEVRDGAVIRAETLGRGQGGDLSVKASEVLLSGDGNETRTGLRTFARSGSSGNAGGLTIEADRLEVHNGAFVGTNTFGSGRGGTLSVRADEVVLSGDGNRVFTGLTTQTASGSSGNAGDLVVTAGHLEVRDGAVISTTTFGSGRGGTLNVRADEVVLSRDGSQASTGIFSNTEGSGDAGNLTVEVRRQLAVRDGAQINASTSGSGRGGELQVKADRVVLTGVAGPSPAGIFTASTTGENRDVGNLGDAGNLGLEVGQLTVRDGAQISARTDGSGRGGDIQILSRDTEIIGAGSRITAASNGTRSDAGESGSIRITAGKSLQLREGSSISLATARANAGDIDLKVGTELIVRKDSRITTSVANGTGDGGNILIRKNATNDPTQFVVLDKSQIVAQAFEGRGGNISIVTNVFLPSQVPDKSVVDASSALGIEGTVEVRALVSELGGTVTPLPETFVEENDLLRDVCAERARSGVYSSFVIRGRGGVPLMPGGLLPSSFLLEGGAVGTDAPAVSALPMGRETRHVETNVDGEDRGGQNSLALGKRTRVKSCDKEYDPVFPSP